MKIWCEECKGTGGKEYDFDLEMCIYHCPICEGKGFVEIEGTVEELALGLAVQMLFETGQHHIIQTYKGCRQAYFYDKEMLIDWYKLQKGGNE